MDFLGFIIGREGIKINKKNTNNIKIINAGNNQRYLVFFRFCKLLPQVYPKIRRYDGTSIVTNQKKGNL
jgi:hypothetical protein